MSVSANLDEPRYTHNNKLSSVKINLTDVTHMTGSAKTKKSMASKKSAHIGNKDLSPISN